MSEKENVQLIKGVDVEVTPNGILVKAKYKTMKIMPDGFQVILEDGNMVSFWTVLKAYLDSRK